MSQYITLPFFSTHFFIFPSSVQWTKTILRYKNILSPPPAPSRATPMAVSASQVEGWIFYLSKCGRFNINTPERLRKFVCQSGGWFVSLRQLKARKPNTNLPYLKGRYELVKGLHFGEIPKRVKPGGRRCSRSIDEFSRFTSNPGFQCLPSDKFWIEL